MDRAYIDFQRLFVFTLSSAFFVVRTKSNLQMQRPFCSCLLILRRRSPTIPCGCSNKIHLH